MQEDRPLWRAARIIVETARRLRHRTPPLRGTPYFGLDAGVSYAFESFEELSATGIFRKYELVLEINSGLGGRARWLSTRLGCRVVGLEGSSEVAAVGSFLDRQASLDHQVTFAAGSPDALPFANQAFTHLWWLDCSPEECSEARLVSALRVVRSGGHLALRCRDDGCLDGERLRARVMRAGFTDVEVVHRPWIDASPTLRNAQMNLAHALRDDAAARRALDDLRLPAVAGHWRLLARRP